MQERGHQDFSFLEVAGWGSAVRSAVEVLRGGRVESAHRGALVVMATKTVTPTLTFFGLSSATRASCAEAFPRAAHRSRTISRS